jgi:hypothetical protein
MDIKELNIKAFHPLTLGVMYHVGIVEEHDDKTITVNFYGADCKKYRIPRNHVSINGELLED